MNQGFSNPRELQSHFIDVAQEPWVHTKFDGIEMKILYSDSGGRSAILFRMKPGAIVPFHEHSDVEMTYMLDGALEDNEGSVTTGNFVWRPGGHRHVARSPSGATFLSIFNRPNIFHDGIPFFTE